MGVGKVDKEGTTELNFTLGGFGPQGGLKNIKKIMLQSGWAVWYTENVDKLHS